MARPVILFSGGFADRSLEQLAIQAAEWGYQGLELCCWGDHFEVQHAPWVRRTTARTFFRLLNRHELLVPVLGSLPGQPGRLRPHRRAPPHPASGLCLGRRQPEGVQQRAVEEMMATMHGRPRNLASASCPASPVRPSGPTSSATPAQLRPWWPTPSQEFAQQWQPILDVCQECWLRSMLWRCIRARLRSICTVPRWFWRPSTSREEFGFTFDPSHLHWQGIDPVEFLRRFPRPDLSRPHQGRSHPARWPGRFAWILPAPGRPPSRLGVSRPGHGGIDWESIIRALNEIGYDGPLSVEWKDPAMNREVGAEEACRFVKRLDFEPAPRPDTQAFR